jgi:hypothetical protein
MHLEALAEEIQRSTPREACCVQMAPSMSDNGGRKRKRRRRGRGEGPVQDGLGAHEPQQGGAIVKGTLRKSLVHLSFLFFDLNPALYLHEVGLQCNRAPLMHNTYHRVSLSDISELVKDMSAFRANRDDMAQCCLAMCLIRLCLSC